MSGRLNRLFVPRLKVCTGWLVVWCACSATTVTQLPAADNVTELGTRRELFVDRHLIERMDGAELRMHPPSRAETGLPASSRGAGHATVFRDGYRYRMYYCVADDWWSKPGRIHYAESHDAIRWALPHLGLLNRDRSKKHNNVWMGRGVRGFAPFIDDRLGVAPTAKYKALCHTAFDIEIPRDRLEDNEQPGLFAMASSDALNWRKLNDDPVMSKFAFDPQHSPFWDTNRKKYVDYCRIVTEGAPVVARTESDDFIEWGAPQPLRIQGPPEDLRTNAVIQYYRAPHYYFSFSKRVHPDRKAAWPRRALPGLSEIVFMSSRDGLHFDRTFMEAAIRPGRHPPNWHGEGVEPAWGMIQTADDEMSIYFGQMFDGSLQRGVFRLDGIASVHAGYDGGELVTKPVSFTGRTLHLNYATSALGSVRVEIQDPAGKPLPGYSLDDAPEFYGDRIDDIYAWGVGDDLLELRGKPVRLRFVLKDANLYSFRFENPDRANRAE